MPNADDGRRPHELGLWISQVTDEMASEYERIRARATEDPATAGDQGEGTWAQLLREWLPASYEVRTKGRILSHDGSASRQVDVVVLRPGYPRKLLEKQLYLTSGVAAAFECKLTLKARHITQAKRTAAEIARMTAPRHGTPYRELVSPIVYGILANSHGWSDDHVAARKVQDYLGTTSHPREDIDLVCIADTFVTLKSVEFNQLVDLPDNTPNQLLCLSGRFLASAPPRPVGSLLAYVLIRLGWEDPQVRPFAEYFRLARMLDRASGGAARIDATGLTPETEAQARLRTSDFLATKTWSWDEWGFTLE